MNEIRFSCPLPPRELRMNVHTVARKNPKPGQSARRALHWSDKSKAADEYAEAVWIAGFLEVDKYRVRPDDGIGPWPRAAVHYAWHSTHQTDEDNIIASMKVALDCLTPDGRRPLSIIGNDKGASVTASWHKAATKAQERVIITITEVEP